MATATATSSKTKIRPLDDRLVVLPDNPEEVTSGGILLPDTAREKPQRGKVMATGPGKLLDSGQRGDMSVKKGDVVWYGKYSGTEVDVNGEKYFVIRESDILAVAE
jgi:chaperonin GroES